MIVHEMIHEARVVPLDGRPQLNEHVQAWIGDIARPVGRRHAGRRDDEFQRQEQLPRVDDRSASDRALHARRSTNRLELRLTVSDPRRGRSRGRCSCRCGRPKAS